MSVQEMVLHNSGSGDFTSNRVLGAVGMLLSPMLFVSSLFYASEFGQPNPRQFWASLGGFLYILGAMLTATAIRSLRVTGSGRGAAILYYVQMTGLLLAMTIDVLEFAAPQRRETLVFFLIDMGYPFSHLLMIVVGTAIVRAKVWRGWRRIPAYLVGFALPSFIVLSLAAGRENAGFIFPLMVTTGFFTLGLAVFTTKPAE